MSNKLVLSLFPGVGLLDAAFERAGFCVVRGPDLLWGGDVRRFTPPCGVFAGVIGGPPCQDFSSARREPRRLDGDGAALLGEFRRVVVAAGPRWWLCENVDGVPDVRVPGYSWQRLDVEQAWFCPVRRLRHVQFGAKPRAFLDVPAGRVVDGAEPAALACDGRTFAEVRELQGLDDGFDLPGFTVEAKKRAVGNGVPRVLADVLAAAVVTAIEGGWSGGWSATQRRVRRCECGCMREVRGRARLAGVACRKRAERRRRRVTGPGAAA